MDLEKPQVGNLVQLAREISVFFEGADEGYYADHPGVGHQAGDFGYAPDVFCAVVVGKA